MTDCEVVDVQFLRRSAYADYVRFLEDFDGFRKHRWGDHAVRVLGVALAGGRIAPASVSHYAHQVRRSGCLPLLCISAAERNDISLWSLGTGMDRLGDEAFCNSLRM